MMDDTGITDNECVLKNSEKNHLQQTDENNVHALFDPNVNQDELILAQQHEIEKEICEKIPLVGVQESCENLVPEYHHDAIYKKKIKDLCAKYCFMRRTRPDGNCFFRAFSFAFFEQLLGNKEEFDKFHKVASKSKDMLIALGFPHFTIEDFHETFMDVLGRVGKQISVEELHATFNDQSYSDYIVVFLRLVTSGQLQKDAEFYTNFIEGDRDIKDFCSQEVEPMYKESDHIHIIALSSALGVGIRVRYMDRGKEEEVVAHDFPEGCTPSVELLYRPGHYDILYLKPPAPVSESNGTQPTS